MSPVRHYVFGDFRLDVSERALFRGTELVPLTPKALETLLFLVERRGHIVEKEDLMKAVWPDTFVEEVSLARNISVLRKTLAEGSAGKDFIETVPKRGYRFIGQVEESNGYEAAVLPSSPSSAADHSSLRSRLGWLGAVAALVLVAASLIAFSNRPGARQAAVTQKPVKLAVLPVQNLTGDSSQDYVADGLTEELIAELGGANPDRLAVIARTSAMTYKQTSKPIDQIGKELGVDYALETSLRESSGQVRFTAQLIRTKDQTHLWARNFDRPMSDILALQGELARTVAEEIRIGLPPEVAARLASPRGVRPEAYDAYLKGRFYWNKRTPEDMTRAEDYFQQAIQADSTFAPGYAGLADCYQVMVNLGQLEASDGFARARAAASRALELDKTLAEAHTSLASIRGDYDWDWQGAEAEYKQALELNANYATAHHWYGEFLAGVGRYDEAAAEINKAQQVDPLSPVIGVTLGQMHCRAGRCEQGIEEIKKTLTFYPDFDEAHAALAEIYGRLGMYRQSLAEFKKERQPPAGRALLLAGYAAAKAGRKHEALSAFQRLEKQDSQHADYYKAIIYAALGNTDQAFASLERARQSHDWFMPYFRADIKLDNLRADPRFADICRRMNMPG